MHQGNFNKALQMVEARENSEDLDPEELLAGKILKSRILTEMGDYEDSLQLIEVALADSKRLNKPLFEIDACIAKAWTLENRGKYNESLDVLNLGEQIIKKLESTSPARITQRRASLMCQKGRNICRQGDLEGAMPLLEQSLTLYAELEDQFGILFSLRSASLAYYLKGDLTRALGYCQRSLAQSEELGYKISIANALNNIGVVYTTRGEINQALEYYQQSLALFEELGNEKSVGMMFHNIGVVYRGKGLLNQALDFLQRALLLAEEVGGNVTISNILYWLISLAIDTNSLKQARQYLERLEKINDQERHKVINQCYCLSEALLLRQSPRIRDKAKAQESLQKLSAEEIIFPEYTIQAMFNLCELLLDEFNAYGEDVVFQEAKAQIEKLGRLGQQQHSVLLSVHILILRAKFAMIEGNLAAARRFLDQAENTAKENQLVLLAEKAFGEKQSLENQYDKWQELIQSNAPFQARVEQARLEEYLVKAKRLVSFDN